MKITLIGAAGVRTPLLVHGLAEAATGTDLKELALWDVDPERLSIVKRVADAMAKRSNLRAQLTAETRVEAALEGASYVITSIRVGGIDARIKDETIALAHGLVGQETVGAGGFACAMRNLGAMLEYARIVERVAPRATIINFTNPVGIISQGVLNHSGARIIGVCDTPLETFEAIAGALRQNPFELKFDYLGLNHLGWVRSIRDSNGKDLLPKVLSSRELIAKCYRHQLFPVDFIQQLRLLPTEYLYFYYYTEAALRNTRNSGNSRGQAVASMNQSLFRRLVTAGESELIPIYEGYLRERNASYFSIEATAGQKREDRNLYSDFSGYERIALLVLQALNSQQPRVIPLTTRNENALQDLDTNDAVELPCEVSVAGVKPLAVGRAPDQVRELLLRVKEYERLTVKARVEHSRDAAVAALVNNPLVAKPDAARGVLADYIEAFGAQMSLNGN